ncbi:MAG: winged helix-turn-helix domain-containing protein [Candidatus Diapherotrites archaeon]
MDEMQIGSMEIKALSSETRTEILKLLNERKYTLSELSKKKGIAASSMKQQLEILEESELIHGIDEGRKWKYYSLTPKGKKLIESRNKPMQIALIFGAGLLLIAFIGILISSNMLPITGMQEGNQLMGQGLSGTELRTGTAIGDQLPFYAEGTSEEEWCITEANWEMNAETSASAVSGSMTILGKELKEGQEMCHAVYSSETPEVLTEIHYYFNNEKPPKIIMETYKNNELQYTSEINQTQ